jgi:hypothetical protein
MRKAPLIAFLGAALVSGAALSAIPGRGFSVVGLPLDRQEVEEPQEEALDVGPVSPFTGLPCPAGEDGAPREPHRPVAIMLAGDDHVRPLSGIGTADVVVEMPVIAYGINRFMAVHTCGGDFEIGSIRSSRDDYIPIAAALDAIYGHWGGSYLALNQLRNGIADNVDALRNPFGAYYRKSGIPAPDNGFTTLPRMLSAAGQLQYRTTLERERLPYTHSDGQSPREHDATKLEVGYFGPYRVEWRYDEATDRYLRFRGGREEMEQTTGQQVTAGTIIVMRTRVTQAFGQYNDVTVTGSGEVTIYRNGTAISGAWEKAEAPLEAPLTFKDANGRTIPFARGPVWLEVVQSDTPVTATGAEPVESTESES